MPDSSKYLAYLHWNQMFQGWDASGTDANQSKKVKQIKGFNFNSDKQMLSWYSCCMIRGVEPYHFSILHQLWGSIVSDAVILSWH